MCTKRKLNFGAARDYIHPHTIHTHTHTHTLLREHTRVHVCLNSLEFFGGKRVLMEIDEGLFLPIFIFKEVCKKTECQSIFQFCLFCLRNTGFLETLETFLQTKKPFAKSIRTYYELNKNY